MIELDKIYNQDCLEGMKMIPDGSVDAVITSPPYNKGERKNGGKLVHYVFYNSYNDDMEESEYQENQIAVINEIHRILKPNGSLFYNHKNRYNHGFQISPLDWIRRTRFSVRQEIVWDRGLAANIRGWRFWQTDERIYWLQKKEAKMAELSMDFAKLTSVWKFPPEKKDMHHPCPFPEKLSDRCVASVCKEGDVVLDPYIGTGTVAVSAIKYKCSFIGFEVDKEYYDKACERIQQEKSQLTIF